MKTAPIQGAQDDLIEYVADYAAVFESDKRALHPSATLDELRLALMKPLPKNQSAPVQALDELIRSVEPGLVGNRDPNFFAWVMGASSPVGVAADWLTSLWGQNAAIYQTSPAAAVAEEAVGDWLKQLLRLPKTSSVGFVTGATMASFVSLAAARASVLERFGHDYYQLGLQGAPKVHFFVSDDIHASNLAAIRYLGFGETNIVKISSDREGRMYPEALGIAMAETEGPKIVIAQAGHINSGAFEDFRSIAQLSKANNAWLHIDGAFGLWARLLPEKNALTEGIELADSWSVDGHKWLQIPYDSGFAIVKDAQAHQKAMAIDAGYLNQDPEDGRNPTNYNPELSRRARGFAAWAVIYQLGREGIETQIRDHCEVAQDLAEGLRVIRGVEVVNDVTLNQIVIRMTNISTEHHAGEIERLSSYLNESGIFVRPVIWKNETLLRLSVISQRTSALETNRVLAEVHRFVHAQSLAFT